MCSGSVLFGCAIRKHIIRIEQKSECLVGNRKCGQNGNATENDFDIVVHIGDKSV